MKIYPVIISLGEEMFDAECTVTEVSYRMVNGHKTVESFEVAAISISNVPAIYYKDETIQEAESQMRHDQSIREDLQELADLDYGDYIDNEYEKERDRRIA